MSPSEVEPSASRQIARAASTIMLAFVVSNLVGLMRQILVARSFGTQPEMEAFNAANRVSETLFNLVAGGALSSAFIPTFTGLLTRGERKNAWKLASSIANLVVVTATLVALFSALFAPQVVRYILAPGFASNPNKEALTISLMRLMLPSAIIFGISGLVMGVLNSHQIFLVPALTPAMYQVGLIFGVLVLAPKMGIYGLAWGVLGGAAMHLGLQVPALLRLKGEYFPTFGLKMPEVREVARLMGPRLLGVAVVQLNFWVNTRLASRFVEGSVTGLVLGFTLMLMPQAAIAQSIAIAAMPTFSAQVALGKIEEMRHTLISSLRGMLFFCIPASLGLMLLRKPIVALLYQRGEFTAFSTELVSWALLWYSAGLVGHGLVEVLSRGFYSLHDTKTPVMVGIGAMTLNVLGSYFFSAIFLRIGWMPHGGLALANSFATAVEAVCLLILMRRKLGAFGIRGIVSGAFQSLSAAMIMAVVVYLWLGALQGRSLWIIVLGGILTGSLGFGSAALVLGIPEARQAGRLLSERVGLRRY